MEHQTCIKGFMKILLSKKIFNELELPQYFEDVEEFSLQFSFNDSAYKLGY